MTAIIAGIIDRVQAVALATIQGATVSDLYPDSNLPNNKLPHIVVYEGAVASYRFDSEELLFITRQVFVEYIHARYSAVDRDNMQALRVARTNVEALEQAFMFNRNLQLSGSGASYVINSQVSNAPGIGYGTVKNDAFVGTTITLNIEYLVPGE